MRAPADTIPEIDSDLLVDVDDTVEPAPDSQFESFYDAESGAWTLRRIPSSPPVCGAEDDAA